MEKVDKEMKTLTIENPDEGICDCNDEQCVGCFWPKCESCSSNKCGHECRINRLWKYEKYIVQGKSE